MGTKKAGYLIVSPAIPGSRMPMYSEQTMQKPTLSVYKYIYIPRYARNPFSWPLHIRKMYNHTLREHLLLPRVLNTCSEFARFGIARTKSLANAFLFPNVLRVIITEAHRNGHTIRTPLNNRKINHIVTSAFRTENNRCCYLVYAHYRLQNYEFNFTGQNIFGVFMYL